MRCSLFEFRQICSLPQHAVSEWPAPSLPAPELCFTERACQCRLISSVMPPKHGLATFGLVACTQHEVSLEVRVNAH